MVDRKLLSDMTFARLMVTDGLAARAAAKIKVRQPLAKLTYYHTNDLSEGIQEIIKDEVNVKVIKKWSRPNPQGWIELDIEITPELKAEGLMRDVVRQIQSARKAAGLEVDDRIVLTLMTESGELARAIEVHADVVG